MNLKTLFLGSFAIVGLEAASFAHDLELGFRRHSRHGDFSIGLSLPLCERRAPRPSFRVWVPGRYETRYERVWVDGECRRVWIEPCHEIRKDYRGCSYRVLVREGHYETIREPGRFETREVRVWVDGHWQTSR